MCDGVWVRVRIWGAEQFGKLWGCRNAQIVAVGIVITSTIDIIIVRGKFMIRFGNTDWRRHKLVEVW